MTIDKATIINWALGEIGAGPMFSIDDGSDLAEQVENTWQKVVLRVFGMHDWSFAKGTFRMRRLAEPLENGWPYAFDLPGDRIGNPLAYFHCVTPSPELIRHFTLQQGKMCCNHPAAYAVCKVAVDPDYWDAPFLAAFVTALAGNLAVPVWQDENMRDSILAKAFGSPSLQGTGGDIGRLMAQDKASAPVGEESLLAHDPLTSVRPTGGMHSGPWHGSF